MNEPATRLLAAFGSRFLLREEYASGEGRTLRVAHEGHAEDLIVKVLPPGEAPTEASLLLSLRHSAIPAVRELERLPDGRAFVVREFVDELPNTLRQLLEVLAYVHLRGVVHLDLKPANLLRGRDGALHLLDFGLGLCRTARWYWDRSTSACSSSC